MHSACHNGLHEVEIAQFQAQRERPKSPFGHLLAASDAAAARCLGMLEPRDESPRSTLLVAHPSPRCGASISARSCRPRTRHFRAATSPTLATARARSQSHGRARKPQRGPKMPYFARVSCGHDCCSRERHVGSDPRFTSPHCALRSRGFVSASSYREKGDVDRSCGLAAGRGACEPLTPTTKQTRHGCRAALCLFRAGRHGDLGSV